MYKIEVLTRKQLLKEVYGDSGEPILQTQENSENVSYFKNFHYFCPDDLINYHHNPVFIIVRVAGTSPGNIIGVLRYDRYEYEINYLAINYVDIHEKHKSKGISKILLSKLNQLLKPTDYLVGSRLSEEGRKCKMDQVTKRIITNCQYYDSDIDLSKALR